MKLEKSDIAPFGMNFLGIPNNEYLDKIRGVF